MRVGAGVRVRHPGVEDAQHRAREVAARVQPHEETPPPEGARLGGGGRRGAHPCGWALRLSAAAAAAAAAAADVNTAAAANTAAARIRSL